jgi:hypothetical protein
MMNKKFANPYIIYYPVLSRDSMPFPVNCTVRGIQEEVNKGRRLCEEQLWLGNLVAAKFTDDRFTQMMDASMADFPILKNFLGTHASPGSGSAVPTQQTPYPDDDALFPAPPVLRHAPVSPPPLASESRAPSPDKYNLLSTPAQSRRHVTAMRLLPHTACPQAWV